MSFKKFREKAFLGRNQSEIIDALHHEDSFEILKITDGYGNTPIHSAVQKKQYKLVEAYVNFIKDSRKYNGKIQSLSSVIYDQKTNHRTRFYLNLGNRQGLTPIHLASYNGDLKMMKFLEQNGARYDQKSNAGLNIFHIASQSNQPITFFNYSDRLNLNICDSAGNSPLHWASNNGSQKVVGFLLANYAQLDTPNNEGDTPLHIAVRQKKNTIIKKLLLAGANRHLLNKQKKSPIDISANIKSLILQDLFGQSSQFCQKRLNNQKPKKRIKILVYTPPIIFTLVLFYNLIRHLLHLTLSIYFIIFALAVVFSLLNLGLFVYLTGVYQQQNRRQSINIDEYIDFEVFCFYCNIEKNITTTHCYICKKCITMKYKHCWAIDKCIDYTSVLIYIIMNLINVCLSGIGFYVALYELLLNNFQINWWSLGYYISLVLMLPFIFYSFIQISKAIAFKVKQSYRNRYQYTISDSFVKEFNGIEEEIQKRKKNRRSKKFKEPLIMKQEL